jgi:hypothetical protein
MQRLRQLILLLSFASLYSGPALSAPGQVGTRITSISSSGEANVARETPNTRASSWSSTILARSPSFFSERLALKASVNSKRSDYSSTILRDRLGNQTKLGDSFDGLETSSETGLDFSARGHMANIDYGRMLSRSPYPYDAWNAGYSYGFFAGTTTVGGNYSSTRLSVPRSFYIDPRDFVTRKRPESLTSQRLEVFLEQVLSETWKLHVRGFQGVRFEDRPKHLGTELRLGHAISDRWFARLDLGTLREGRNQTLKDERGYFSLYWAEVEASFEPIYDLTLSAAFGTTIERESIPYALVTRQVGSDNYGLKASYRGGPWTATIAGALARSNTDFRSRSITAELAWEI